MFEIRIVVRVYLSKLREIDSEKRFFNKPVRYERRFQRAFNSDVLVYTVRKQTVT